MMISKQIKLETPLNLLGKYSYALLELLISIASHPIPRYIISIMGLWIIQSWDLCSKSHYCKCCCVWVL